ncbi:Polysaccharide biosynthesis protein [Paenibacillaceae bacterium GAS479]|nr:Polysaccharide biosynthesis protein [Paenibacillaceae bacterium GAS479]
MDKTILVTGGTGSWGVELVRQLLVKQPKEIRIFSRNESLQVQMQREIGDPRLQFVIGDIRDKSELMMACSDVGEVYHLAALKHVPICEEQPDSALKTNVMGTQNVIDAAIESGVRKVMYVSTDKASNPNSTYGMTKALGEKLILSANARSAGTSFACFRSGNVLGSAGSVIPLFQRQLKDGCDLTVTDPGMTRFFLTLGNAVQILQAAMDNSQGGEVYIPKMGACNIMDLARVMIQYSGRGPVNIRYVGIRPGEKLHETLITETESNYVVDLDERYFVIMPPYSSCDKIVNGGQRSELIRRGYHSDDWKMSHEEIGQLLHQGGFLA